MFSLRKFYLVLRDLRSISIWLVDWSADWYSTSPNPMCRFPWIWYSRKRAADIRQNAAWLNFNIFRNRITHDLDLSSLQYAKVKDKHANRMSYMNSYLIAIVKFLYLSPFPNYLLPKCSWTGLWPWERVNVKCKNANQKPQYDFPFDCSKSFHYLSPYPR